jgi:hypothetical protein
MFSVIEPHPNLDGIALADPVEDVFHFRQTLTAFLRKKVSKWTQKVEKNQQQLLSFIIDAHSHTLERETLPAPVANTQK